MKKIGIIVGSIKEGSLTQKLSNNLAPMFSSDYEVQFINISELPIYNEDLDNGKLPLPKSYTEFRNTMKSIDALIFVTPEHNRSIPAILKNALDVGSRPYGLSIWDRKPALIVSQSPSNLSGFGANHHLRQILVFLNMYPLQQPEVYLANSYDLFNEKGQFNNEDTIIFLKKVVQAFESFMSKF